LVVLVETRTEIEVNHQLSKSDYGEVSDLRDLVASDDFGEVMVTFVYAFNGKLPDHQERLSNVLIRVSYHCIDSVMRNVREIIHVGQYFLNTKIYILDALVDIFKLVHPTKPKNGQNFVSWHHGIQIPTYLITI